MQRVALFQPFFRSAAQQHLGIGMARTIQNLLNRRLFHDASGVHYRHPVGDLHRRADIVGHKNDRQIALLLLLAQQDQDLYLHRGIERGGWLIRQQQLRVAGEREGDHRPLAHSAGHLVRVSIQPPLGARNAYLAQRLQRPFPRRLSRQAFMATQPFDNLLAHGIDRVEGQQRLLENHRAARAAVAPQLPGAHLQHLLFPDPQRAGKHAAFWRMQAHQGAQGDAFTGARFADQRHHLAFLYIKGDAVDRVDRLTVAAKLNPQVADMDVSFMRHGSPP